MTDSSLKKLKSAAQGSFQYDSDKVFAGSLRAFLHGENRQHLSDWYKESCQSLDKNTFEELSAALVGLDAENYRDRRKAKKVLKANMELAVPLLVNAKYNPISYEQRENCRELLNCNACADDIVGAQQLTVSFRDPSRSRYGCGMGYFNCYSKQFTEHLTS